MQRRRRRRPTADGKMREIFSNSNGQALYVIYILTSIGFFCSPVRRGGNQKQTTFRSVDTVYGGIGAWCLSCHKSGTSFRFLMILILVCRVFVGPTRFIFLFFFVSSSLYDSFVYDRNIHLTTSFRQGSSSRTHLYRWWRCLSFLFIFRCIHSSQTLAQWIKWTGGKEREKKRGEFARKKWINMANAVCLQIN